MRKSSREVISINTSPPEERVQLLKPINEIEQMPDESEEIHSGGLLKRYIERPASLQNVTLADWAAMIHGMIHVVNILKEIRRN